MPENFSLGVTQLLDDLLANENSSNTEKTDSDRGNEDALRRTFQRTQALCAEAEHFFALVAQEEGDAKREAAEKMSKAERRLGLNDTLDSMNLNATGDSLYEVLEANEAKLARVRQDIVDIMHKKGPKIPAGAETPFARTVDMHFGDTMADTREMPSGVLDFEKLLADCDAMQAELCRWGGLRNTPQGWRRLDPEELNR
eukprot:TRINITY_DN14767_c0_g3_i1.p1 TRINITY_DN14767_c0_g3~~TRINITY_DN14767_c0_g3_i1.p1  ORF type:complete len:199 (+),score=44.42 TRINITY_DN14767_c0_g3_i1:76-672(+)